MERVLLAEELREKKRLLGGPDSAKYIAMPDNELINSFVACPSCGELMAAEEEIEGMINEAQDTNEFLVFSLLDITYHDHPLLNPKK